MSKSHLPPRVAANLQRVLKAEDERSFGQLAVDKGLISTHQLEEALAQRGDTPLKEILLSKGWIRPSDVERLAEIQRTERLTPVGIPAAAKEVLTIPERNLDEYVLVSMIGRGGMGEVWKAWDRRLDRWVAIKLSTPMPDSGMTLERFHREAVAAARLSHPNIVPIYRVAQQNDRPYIVMKWIEGSTLYKHRLDVRRSMEVIHDVARAVHYAHQQGVIHRDLKPGNIMIDTSGTVWVLDFGLAHLLENQRQLTTAGTTVGTPAYMSPEQAKGEKGAKEPTTDVYSIGATLYEMLTGRPPFQGDNVVDLVHKVTDEEPTQARILNPEINREVETILQKAMDKDHRRRYPSAFDLAEDIRRYLNDEPIMARPISWHELVVRRVRKNPLVSGLAAAILVSIVAVVLFYVMGRAAAKEREAALTMIRETARGTTEMALQFRRHGNALVMGHSVRILENAYDQAIKVVPEQPEVEYLMGRMYRALMQYDQALKYQERALKKDARYAPALYERIILRVRHYQQDYAESLKAAAEEEGDRLTPYIKAELEKTLEWLREDLLADVRVLESRYSEIGETEVLAVRGILAWLMKDYDQAEKALRQVVEKDPLKEEAWEALTSVYQDKGEAAVGSSAKIRHWQAAIDCFKNALTHDKGYIPHYVGLCQVHFLIGGELSSQGGDPTPHWLNAIRAINTAVTAEPENKPAHIIRSGLRLSIADYKRDRGGDPTDDFNLAEQDINEVLRLDPGNASALYARAEVMFHRAFHKGRRGQDPQPEWQAAERDLNKVQPVSWKVRLLLAVVHMDRANSKKERGVDPTLDYEIAEKQFEQSLRLKSGHLRTLRNRALMNIERGVHQLSIGKDPTEAWAKAEADIKAVLEKNTADAIAYLRLAVLKSYRGIAALRIGQDGEKVWKESDEYFERGLKENPASANGWFRRGQLWLNWGLHRAGRGLDATAQWQNAEKYYNESLKLNPESDEALSGRGTLKLNRGSIAWSLGGDPENDWKEAEADLKKAIEVNPMWWEGWSSLGQLYQTRGLAVDRRGGDPFPLWKQADECLSKAIDLNGLSAEARVVRGHLRHLRALEISRDRGDAMEEWKRAEEDLAAALRIDSTYLSAFLTRSQLRINRGSYRNDHGEDPLKDWEAAEEDIREILRLSPGHSKALTYRVGLLMNRGVYWIHQEKDPSADWKTAETDLTELVKTDAKNYELFNMRAMIRTNRGIYEKQHDRDPLPAWAQAEQDYGKSVELNKSSPNTWANRAGLYWMRAGYLEGLKKSAGADYGRAALDYAEAVRLNPTLKSRFEERIQEAKSKSEQY